MDKNDIILGKWSPNWEARFWIIQVFSNNTYEIKENDPEHWTLSINGKYLKGYKPMLQEIQITE